MQVRTVAERVIKVLAGRGRELLLRALERVTFPDNHGRPVRRDPSHGRIDRDVQWRVQRQHPTTVAQRVVMESNLQRAKDRS